MKLPFPILFLFAIPLSLFSQSKFLQYRDSISIDTLKKHLYILADNDMEGRHVGTKGQEKAARYIENEFAKYGLAYSDKENNSYRQHFNLITNRQTKQLSIRHKRKNFFYSKNFYTTHHFKMKKEEYENVFIGYGIENEKYSDYKEVNLTGKIAVILIGSPKITNSLKREGIYSDKHKIRLAHEYGAAGVLFVFDNDKDYTKEQYICNYRHSPGRPILMNYVNDEPSDFGVFYFDYYSGKRFIGQELKYIKKQLVADLETYEKTYENYTSSSTINMSSDILETENIIGFLEGTTHKDEYIVLTAHYDHLGTLADVYNGADDNASGVSALLEVAKALSTAAKNGHRLNRSIVFMASSAEEKGLLGSEFYVSNPIYPLDKTVLNINMDMVGRAKTHKDRYIIDIITSNPKIHKFHNSINLDLVKNLVFDISKNDKDHPEQLFYRSDQYNFYKHDVNFIFFSTGSHRDYHQPSDDAKRINYDGLYHVTRHIYLMTIMGSNILEFEE